MAVDPSTGDLDLRQIVQTLLRRRWIVLSGVLLGALLGAGLALFTTIIYESTAVISFESDDPHGVQLTKPAKELADGVPVINEVIETAGFPVPNLSERFTSKIVDSQLQLRVLDDNKEHAIALAKKWACTVARSVETQNANLIALHREKLGKAMEAMHEELRTRQSEMKEFLKEHDAYEKLEANPVFDSLRMVTQDRLKRLTDYNCLQVELQFLTKPDISSSELLHCERAHTDPKQRDFEQLLDSLNLQKASLPKDDAAIKKLDEQIARTQAAMLDLARSYKTQVQVDLDQGKQVLDRLDTQIEQLHRDIAKARRDHEEYMRLSSEIRIAEKRYSETANKAGELDLYNSSRLWKINDDGEKNASIYKKKEFARNTILGLFGGVFVAFLVVGLWELMGNGETSKPVT
jgi:uncharacterized protein involved in exopolysaccharide biosynthesis